MKRHYSLLLPILYLVALSLGCITPYPVRAKTTSIEKGAKITCYAYANELIGNRWEMGLQLPDIQASDIKSIEMRNFPEIELKQKDRTNKYGQPYLDVSWIADAKTIKGIYLYKGQRFQLNMITQEGSKTEILVKQKRLLTDIHFVGYNVCFWLSLLL
jgi:hypothetical protein